ncbi:helicase RepA family protein [Mariniblastus sp.]|nr:helicase RepA family protein [Mariniblastus sp.]
MDEYFELMNSDTPLNNVDFSRNGTAATAKPKTELIGFSEFLKANPKMREPVIDRVIRRGETCNVIAASKAGKSWLATDMALAVATGTPWLKQFETSTGTVVYLDLELHPEVFASRLDHITEHRKYCRDTLQKNFHPCCLRGESGDLTTMNNLFSSLEGMNVRLIVLDAWYRLLPPGTSENDNAQMTTLYNLLDRYARQLNCAFVIIHHASKGNQSGKAVTDVGSGAGAMARAADTHLTIRPHEDDGLYVMEAATRSFPPLDPVSLFYTHPCWYVSQTEPVLQTNQTAKSKATEQQTTADMNLVVQEFKAGEPFNWCDVRKLLGCGESKADRIIRTGLEKDLWVKHEKMKRPRARTETMTYKVCPTGTATGTPTSSDQSNTRTSTS